MSKTLLTAVLVFLFAILMVVPKDVLAFQIERPYYITSINAVTDNATTDTVASVGLNARLVGYNPQYYNQDSCDGVHLELLASANTREGIYYNSTADYYNWHTSSELMYNLQGIGDDTVYGPIYFNCTQGRNCGVRYYGGPGYLSASGYLPGDGEYNAIWICTNGWISFVDPQEPAPPAVRGPPIPYQGQPNALVLPYSGILKPSQHGLIEYGEVSQNSAWSNLPVNAFCISWDSVPDEYGNLQSFQIVIEQEPYNLFHYPRQTYVWFNYKNINVNSYSFLGLEDQTGTKAATMHSTDLQNTTTYMWTQLGNRSAAYVTSMKIAMSCGNDAHASTTIENSTTGNEPRGYNLQMQNSLSNYDYLFQYTVAGDATSTLLGAYAMTGGVLAGIAAGGGIIVGCVVLGVELWEWASLTLAESQLYQSDWKTYGQALANGTPVDARFGMIADWVFSDEPPMYNHTLTVTATLQYYTEDGIGDILGYYTLPVTVTINMFYPYNNDSFSNAWELTSGVYYYNWLYMSQQDQYAFYKVNVSAGDEIDVVLNASTDPMGTVGLLLYNQTQPPIIVHNGTNGSWYEGASYVATVSGYVWIEAYYVQSAQAGWYSLGIDVYPYSAPGGCPFVSPWNGSSYVADNNLLGASEQTNGTDVQDYYKLEQVPVPTYQGHYFSTYSLMISEFENQHSYLDQVRLTAIDAGNDTNVAVTPTGEILTYENPQPPIMAI